MFSNFQTVFKDKPFYESEIPKGILTALSEELPKGFKYVNAGNGLCKIETEEEFNIKPSSIVLPQKAKEKINDKSSMQELWSYLYNSQNKAEFLPNAAGEYIINGKPIKAEYLVISPFNDKFIECEKRIFLNPPKFPKPQEIELSVLDEKVKILIQRQANNSITEMKFVSVEKRALEISFTIDEEKNKFDLSISINYDNAINIKDIIQANKIYNGFMEGEGAICDLKLPKFNNIEGNKKSEEEMQFWEKALKLEEYLQIEFSVNTEITLDIIESVNLLYNCLINKIPYKKFEEYESVSGKGNVQEWVNNKKIEGQEINFEFISEATINIMNQEIKMYHLIAIFNATVKKCSIQKNNELDHFEVYLNTKEGEKMYSGNMYFISEEEVQKYREDESHIEKLKNAHEINTTT